MNLTKLQLINTLYGFTALVTCVFLGKLLSYIIPILPGSLYGLIIFTLTLHFRIFDPDRVKTCVVWCIKNMGICFVPAGVGIMNHFDILKQYGIAITGITFATTFVLLTAIGVIYQQYENIKNRDNNF